MIGPPLACTKNMNQLSISFPRDPNDLESFWARLGHLRPAEKAPEAAPAKAEAPKSSAQLVIWQTEESVALRFSFRVPVYSKKGMLKDWALQHVAKSNLISVEDFAAPPSQGGFQYDANKLAALFKDGAREALIKKLGLNAEQAKLVEFRGLSVARHLAGTKVEVSDARWV